MGYTRRRAAALAVLATTTLIAAAAAQAGVSPRGGRTQAAPAARHNAVFDVRGRTRDRVTGTRRLVARRRGFLTGRTRSSAASVALRYVRRNPDAFGLDAGDLAGLRQVRRYRFGDGATHLQWEQTYRGIPVFGTEVRANVDSEGRLINAGGAPLPDPSVASIVPTLSAREAVRAAGGRKDSGELVLFPDVHRVRLAWRVLAQADPRHLYDAVVDARSGALLYRRNLVLQVAARAFDNYPGAPLGGTQVAKNFPDSGSFAWLSDPNRLFGNYAHVYSDEDDEDVSEPGREIPRTGGTYNYSHLAESAQSTGQDCPATPGCSYNNFTMVEPDAFSWRVNRAQAGTQLFYFVNRFHDHLRDAQGIAFTPSSGNFEGGDRVRAEVDNGASTETDSGFEDLPACNQVNNADFTVGPDGSPPRMQTYLWTSACPPGGVTHDVDGANDAFLVYHEYTHGLSNRLVTDAAGFGALNGPQSSAMGEGWSDWYALDLLVAEGRETDTPAPGELRTGKYENDPVRTEPFDCPAGGGGSPCPGTSGGGPGGYTYGDFAKILGFPEEHADGEIWVQTLWDLRRALIAAHGPTVGTVHARALVTDGMRLSPASPSFLDMRNAILQADVNRRFGDRDRIWAVFAARGMGVDASTTGDSDIFPREGFTRPPPLPVPDVTASVISRFSMTRRRFRVGRSRTPRTALAPRGSTFRFRLSEAATVRITIHRGLAGRRVGKRCRRPSRRLRKRKRCTRYVRRATLTRRNLKAGSRRVKFSGRIGRSALKRGSYRATISATDAARNRSRTRRTSFRIVRR